MAKTYYPLTKMNFLVTLAGEYDGASAAFSEVTGIDATVEVIEFRQGNSASLAPVKIPGLVKHGNLTLKYGLTKGSEFKDWIINCTSERRPEIDRQMMTIELIDVSGDAPQTLVTETQASNVIWTFSNAWVTKYSGPDLNATTSEVAIETVEIAYEELLITNVGTHNGADSVEALTGGGA
ncbi:MAG: phage tail protein [Oscillospiraceae bacterium]|nr:phage tail protein [Oscillospiraceae bacterium]